MGDEAAQAAFDAAEETRAMRNLQACALFVRCAQRVHAWLKQSADGEEEIGR
jgi:hypothetical protein